MKRSDYDRDCFGHAMTDMANRTSAWLSELDDAKNVNTVKETVSRGDTGWETREFDANAPAGDSEEALNARAAKASWKPPTVAAGNAEMASKKDLQTAKWFTVNLRLDTSAGTEILVKASGNRMPVLAHLNKKLDPSKGLTLVAYGNDPEEEYGIYAIEASLHQESP